MIFLVALVKDMTMTIAYQCFPERQLTVVVWDGFVTVEEWRRQAMRLIADQNFPTDAVLGDLSTVTGSDFERLDVYDNSALLAARARALPQKLALVAVVQEDPALAAFHQSVYGLPVAVERFQTLDEACRWLAIPQNATRMLVDELRSEARAADTG